MTSTPDNLPPPASDRPQLRSQLDTISGEGARCLRNWQLRRSLREAAQWSPLWLGAVPALVLLARAGHIVDGAPVGIWTMAGLTLIGPLLYIIVRVVWTMMQFQPSRAATLALHDRNLETKDRLVIADEFIGSADLTSEAAHSAFMRAAVDDAREFARRALVTPLPPLPVPSWKISSASWWGVPVALVLILLGRVVISPSLGQPIAGKPLPLVADASPVAKPTDNPNLNIRRAVRPPPEPEPTVSDEKAPASTPQMPRRAKKDQPMDGQPASGGGAQASMSNTGTQSAGQASSQRSKSAQKKPEVAKPEEQQEKESAEAKKKKAKKKKDTGQLAMDSNSGQGKSSSSSSNLSPFEAPEQPDKTGQDPKADAEDDGDEDEDEAEKSNGTNKPMDNTKAPAVDRNLSTQPPGEGPPGNGRGGPGEIKKTRGVPSMILGLPVPDRIPGTPSPGRSKVTQEYTRPKEESHPLLEAQSHATRSGPVGHIEQPDLLPWRRSLVENYFISVRQRAEDGADPDAAPAPVAPKR